MAGRTKVVESMRILGSGAAALVLLLGMTGCQSKTAATKENFTVALNTYYASHDDCMFPGGLRFPYEVSARSGAGDGPVSAKQLDALANAGMLQKTDDKELHINRYVLTPAGTRATVRFCYGHRMITSIDSSTEPAKVNGYPETQLQYHYTLMDVPLWAKSESLQAAFPEMGKAVKGGGEGKARLSQTLAGWQVPE